MTKRTPDSKPGPEPEKPLDSFSNCHTGIMAQMRALGRLPALLEPAAQARRIAGETVQLFRNVVYEHHAEEERELFPAVLAGAQHGKERDNVRAIVEHLVNDHRHVEAAFVRLAPELESIANGQDAALDPAAVSALANSCSEHAVYEEAVFLPLAHEILGRDERRLESLGESLRLRQATRSKLRRLGHPV